MKSFCRIDSLAVLAVFVILTDFDRFETIVTLDTFGSWCVSTDLAVLTVLAIVTVSANLAVLTALKMSSSFGYKNV